MHKYISDFLQTCLDDDNFTNSTKTYFPPWWRFWDRKVKTERSYEGELEREFDEAGKIIRASRKRYSLHPDGFGETFHWETLDLKTYIATSYPHSNVERKIFSDGKCREVYTTPSGRQNVALGYINIQGDLDIYANLSFKNGKQTHCQWIKKVQNPELWKKVLTEFPVSLEEKADRLHRTSQTFRNTHKPSQTEDEQRIYNDQEAKARLQENKKFSQNRLMKMRARKFQKSYLAHMGDRRGSP